MKSGWNLLDRIPLYPLIVGIYPVLFLWLANYSQVQPQDISGALVIALGLTVLVCLLAILLLRKLHRAAAAAGLVLALFFFYGHFYNLVVGWKPLGILLGVAPVTFGLWGLLLVAGLFWIVRTRSDLARVTWFLNRVGGFLLLLVLVQLGYKLLINFTTTAPAQTPPAPGPTTASQVQLAGGTPDVYYIVLDGYDRQDLLKKDIGVDNQDFITQLEQLGFVLPNCTQSNYNTTVDSVAATFTMNYIDALGSPYAEVATEAELTMEKSTPALVAAIHANPVMQQFKEMGYRILTLDAAYDFINFPTSDIVLDQGTSGATMKLTTLKFQTLFLKTTLLQRLVQNLQAEPGKYPFLPGWVNDLFNPNLVLNQKYYKDLDQLAQLDQVTQIPGKKFMYAHLVVTHPDFVFTQTGDLRPILEESRAAYGDQVIYANQRILAIVKNMIQHSATPPIIILQGDHGYGYGGRGIEQFKILNAYYLPGGGKALIYPTITPVNTFRLILSNYFKKNYPLLPDQSIWISSAFPNGYQQVPGSCIQP